MDISYATHTAWSNPGLFRRRLDELPLDPQGLADVLENFMIHHDVVRLLQLGTPRYAMSDHNMRTVERMLSTALRRDRRSLLVPRDIPAYLHVSARDFALIATSVFRSSGIEARVRVGFADYFRMGHWEDHWLCEYRTDCGWRLFDAQLGWRARQALGISFPIHDVPRSRFLSGGDLWLAIRSGEIKAAKCGRYHSGIRGAWLPATNILKDIATLCGVEPLPSDYWGVAEEFSRNKAVSVKAYEELDALARAFSDMPQSPWEARALVSQFPWANPIDANVSSDEAVVSDKQIIALPAWRHVSAPAPLTQATANN
ncbi:transglutaminase domain-containing protein [Nitratireductor sp. XY-223]|uniref:transglutaminase domain-containing protein n=1 Tax=Nitratireductor sp. XY-223 TaxID=2561926 RepID=UPI0010A9AB08|nr:transglutaminase domain-containing protein [Nitratireductor sp. XY-223]